MAIVGAADTKATGLRREWAAGAATAAAAAGEAAAARAVAVAGTEAEFAAGVAAGTTAGALSVAVTRSGTPELSGAIAGAASKHPGGGRANLAIEGAANMSPRSPNVASKPIRKTQRFRQLGTCPRRNILLSSLIFFFNSTIVEIKNYNLRMACCILFVFLGPAAQ